ncbi:hypothetical protein Purlil1_12798 [Purpureocillium lilacinum]|uniref:Transcription factor n=1 Tax=Purpureocillium lilacinum TaxID=33203 RepID=A0ABR0BGH2_PURLI|nr:hypothetical protein Purlil1_12798 [Purpureocillium lilacinum]
MAPTRESAQKPSAPTRAGVGANRQTRGATAKEKEQLKKQLANAEKQLEKADPAKRAELENQIRVSRAGLNGDGMDLDDPDTSAEDKASGTAEVSTDNPRDNVQTGADAGTNDDVGRNADGANADGAANANANASTQENVIKQEEGLFVASHGGLLGHTSDEGRNDGLQPDEPLPSTESFPPMDESQIGLLNGAMEDMSLGPGFGKPEVFFKGYFGFYYGVHRFGFDAGPRYSVHYLGFGKSPPRDGSRSLESQSEILKMGKGERKLVHKIRGVAWKDVTGCSRMFSVSEGNWASAVKQMLVKIQWQDENGPQSWEKLSDFKKYGWGKSKPKFPVARSYAYKNLLLLNKGTLRHPAEKYAMEKLIHWELWADYIEKNGGKRPSGRSSPGAIEMPRANGSAQASESEEL